MEEVYIKTERIEIKLELDDSESPIKTENEKDNEQYIGEHAGNTVLVKSQEDSLPIAPGIQGVEPMRVEEPQCCITENDNIGNINTFTDQDAYNSAIFLKSDEEPAASYVPENFMAQGTSQNTDIIGKVYENGKVNRLNCVQCGKTFKNRANLKNHMKYVHAVEQDVECTECFRTFKSVPYLRSHMNSVHAQTQEVECEHCHKIFMNKKKLNNHIYYTHRQPEDQVSCKICGKTYKSRFNLKVHMRYVHPEGDPHPCPLCYKTFKVDMLLQRHMKWAHPDDGMVYKCQECNKILPSLEGLKTHMKNVHLYNRATCDICRRTLKTKASLERHIKNVHNGQSKEEMSEVVPCTPAEYSCKFCDRAFVSSTSMFWHIERYHAQSQKLPNKICIICDKEFSDYAALHRHLTSVHSLETATCKICWKEFKSSINLQNHIRITHAPPEATQTCETCQKTFKCALHLRMHVLAVHTVGEFPCDICQKIFTSVKYLNKHKKSHIEARDHQCDICLKMYKNVNAVSKHKQQVHNGVKCTICNIKQRNIEYHLMKFHPELSQSSSTTDHTELSQGSSTTDHTELSQSSLTTDRTELSQTTSTSDHIQIDEITCSKCDKSINSFEYTDHAQYCGMPPIVEVKIECMD